MVLCIDLPPIDKRLDANSGQHNGLARAGAVKKARGLAHVLTLDVMRKRGIQRGEFCPRYVWLLTHWRGHRVDYDNRLASIKAYQDGVFRALGVDDREVCSGVSTVVHLDKGEEKQHLSMKLLLFESLADFQNALRSNGDLLAGKKQEYFIMRTQAEL